MRDLFGREEEQKYLDRILHSEQAEFLAVYGRRRVGKTYLIHEYLGDKFGFYASGVLNAGAEVQQTSFRDALHNYGLKESRATNWMQFFFELRDLLSHKYKRRTKPYVVFLDELPCFDTPNSNFLSALDHFWNTWAVWQPTLKLIVCGSATSWMINNLINNHAGLHNRLTAQMYLRQFTLKETELYLRRRGVRWDKQMVIEAYMALGGIPYYLNYIENSDTFATMIDRVYFAEKAPLGGEYRRLFTSLFRSPEPYMRIVELLATCKQGLMRKQIAEQLGYPSGGRLSGLLEDLVNCDFIRQYSVRGKTKVSKTECIYALTDLFSLFHLHFQKKETKDDNYWKNHLNTPLINTWQGLAFEQVVMHHIPQLKQALGVSGMGIEYYAWRSRETEPAAQIDLILDRADHLLNICEIKYSRQTYQLTKAESQKLQKRIDDFLTETNVREGIQLTLITSKGIKPNDYSYRIDKHVKADDLFK